MGIRVTQATLSVLIVPDAGLADIQVSQMFNENLVTAPPTGQMILHDIETLGEVSGNNAIVPAFSTQAGYDVETKPFRHASDVGHHPKIHLPWPANKGASVIVGDFGYETIRLAKEKDFLDHIADQELHNTRPVQEYYYFVAGVLTAHAGVLAIPNVTGYGKWLDAVYLRVSSAPAMQAIIVDVNTLDASEAATSVFTAGNRPQIAAGATRGYSKTFVNNFWAKDSYLSIDIDQIGLGPPGSNLTVTIVAH